jgi:hypothetical protein
MGAVFKPYRTDESRLDLLQKKEGQWIVTNQGKIYCDISDTERILLFSDATKDISIDGSTIIVTKEEGSVSSLPITQLVWSE